MDVVYACRDGWNEEMRYSLRSLSNIPHDKVFVIGGKPDWARNVHFIKVNQKQSGKSAVQLKHDNTNKAMYIACKNKKISDPFIYMNDDFFIMSEMEEIPLYNRGTIGQMIMEYVADGYGTSRYIRGMAKTGLYLQQLGYDNPWCYELHLPMVVYKEPMLEALKICEDMVESGFNPVPLKRSVYGNLLGEPGDTVCDCKYTSITEFRESENPVNELFLSSAEGSFGKVLEKRFREVFPEPSTYEQVGYNPTRFPSSKR